jgi:hypothetical protein
MLIFIEQRKCKQRELQSYHPIRGNNLPGKKHYQEERSDDFRAGVDTTRFSLISWLTTIRQSSQNSLSSPKIRSRTPLFLLHLAHLFIPSPAVAFPCRARRTKEGRPPEDRK